jgi:hypothetical protein
MRDPLEPWIFVRELVFSFPLSPPDRYCAGQQGAAILGEPAIFDGISDGREYTPQHFILEAFRDFPLN